MCLLLKINCCDCFLCFALSSVLTLFIKKMFPLYQMYLVLHMHNDNNHERLLFLLFKFTKFIFCLILYKNILSFLGSLCKVMLDIDILTPLCCEIISKEKDESVLQMSLRALSAIVEEGQ